MGVNRQNGITYNHYGQVGGSYRDQAPSAWDYTKSEWAKQGFDLNYDYSDLFSDQSEYAQWDGDEVRNNLYLDEREGYAEDMFQLFDQYKPQLEYIAENAGVSGAELASNLADSGAQYNANYDAMTADANRSLQRMGVNPNSGRYAALSTGNALGKAAGYSSNQNQVRQMSKAQDMNERMQAAQLGLGVGAQGANTYANMGSQMQSAKQFYDQMGEQSRQFNTNAAMQSDQMKLAAQNQMFNQAQQRYNNGLQANYTSSNFGLIKDMDYSYGF